MGHHRRIAGQCGRGDFKNYVLGTMLYMYISEHLASYITVTNC